ncbi:MAG: hypothetical protein ABIF06_01030 [bacterium]
MNSCRLVEVSLLERLTSRFNLRKVSLTKGILSYADAGKIEVGIVRLERESDTDDPIILEIDTRDGSNDIGSRMAVDHLRDVIKDSRVGVWGYVKGSCKLSAMYLLQSCAVRLAVPEATLQFHDMRRVLILDVFREDDPAILTNMVEKLIYHAGVEVTAERFNIARMYQARMPKLSIYRILEMMRDEVELSAEQALEHGVIDIVAPVPPAVH